MRAAEKTIAFVKEWIAGTYTKRQYQNYYIVKTPHAQFLMKSTEPRELMAIRDNSGHIYLIDDCLSLNTWQTPNVINDDSNMSNPFICLIYDNFSFSYTRISDRAIDELSSNDCLSKWKIIDRKSIFNIGLVDPLHISIVDINGKRYVVHPDVTLTREEKNPTMQISLTDWVNWTPEKMFKFPNPWLQYTIVPLYSDKIDKVDDIRGNYKIMAGEAINDSFCMNNWAYVPTKFITIEDITNKPFREPKLTRPNPYAYNMFGGHINLNNLFRRYETVNENAMALKICLNIKEAITSSNWREVFRRLFIRELAEDFIAFFDADDKWLTENSAIAEAGALEAIFRSKININVGGAMLYINKEENISPLNDYVIYIKSQGGDKSTFKKVIPLPILTNNIKGLLNGSN